MLVSDRCFWVNVSCQMHSEFTAVILRGLLIMTAERITTSSPKKDTVITLSCGVARRLVWRIEVYT